MPENREEVILILIISTALILLLGIVIVLALLIQNKRKFLHKQQLSEIKSLHEKTLLQTELKLLEETYLSISQNLHDNVGSNISTAMLLLYRDSKMDEEEAESNRKEAITILDTIVDDLKNIARSLNPDYLYEIGLREAVKHRVEQLEKTKRYNVELFINESSSRLNRQKQVILFSLFQEALNNIQKHAKATKVTVQLNFQADQFTMQIKDDGTGFDQGTKKEKNFRMGSGLLNMKHRSEMIGATFIIKSEQNKGTEIKILVPDPYS